MEDPLTHERSYGFVPVYRSKGEDQFLLVRQTDGHWSFPKGHIEEGETPMRTARRELLEECGITEIQVDPDHSFTEKYTFIGRDGAPVSKTTILFLGFLRTPNVSIQETEVLEYRFVTLDESRGMDLFPGTRRILDEASQVLTSIPLLAN